MSVVDDDASWSKQLQADSLQRDFFFLQSSRVHAYLSHIAHAQEGLVFTNEEKKKSPASNKGRVSVEMEEDRKDSSPSSPRVPCLAQFKNTSPSSPSTSEGFSRRLRKNEFLPETGEPTGESRKHLE
ncbi:hypothetical protein O6H91_02G140400 [Diphasiastrum complanatum]|uniref:Uncharacterized protein n=1 Tax=Diphasiastrum complanatum TaxID=34168 RepID=A0ACC2ELE3_DIPCM|nr:hypothetical protein O6H91_02G140400 [Diphasiastrum complanatum]